MSPFHLVILALKQTCPKPSYFYNFLCCSRAKDRLYSALMQYNDTNPSEDQLKNVADALLSHPYNDTDLLSFKTELLRIINNSNSAAYSDSDYKIKGWLMAESHYFWCSQLHRQWLLQKNEHVNSQEYSSKVQALYILKKKNLLDASSFKKIIESSLNNSAIILLIKDFLTYETLQNIFCLPQLDNATTGSYFNGPLFVKEKLENISAITQADFIDFIDEAEASYQQRCEKDKNLSIAKDQNLWTSDVPQEVPMRRHSR